MQPIDRAIQRPQSIAQNRPDSPFVPMVGESAVRLAHVGLTPVRLDGVGIGHTENRSVRARRDRVGRLGEYRAFVLETPALSTATVAFVPRPSLDLGVFDTEIVHTATGTTASFSIHAGTGTWFAGQHAHHAYQEVRRQAPDLVPDEGQNGARARRRGFGFQVRVDRDGFDRIEALHRTLWAAYVRSLHDALELDIDGAERHARAIEAWKAHRRTVGLVSRALDDGGQTDAARMYVDVVAP